MYVIKLKNILIDSSLNPRLEPYNDLYELKQSIHKSGQKDPIRVYRFKKSKKFILAHGFRRYEVMRQLGFKHIICQIILK